MDAVFEKLSTKFSSWWELLVESLPNLAVAGFILFLAWLAGRLSFLWFERLFERTQLSQAVRSLLARSLQITILAIGFEVALSVLHLDKAAMSFLAGAGIIGLALGFAFQDLVANFISGVALSVRRPFRVGDVIDTNDVVGIAKRVDLRNTTIETFDGRIVLLPNKLVFESKLTNHSLTGFRRVDLSCGISYGEDLAVVKKVVLETLEDVPNRDGARVPVMYFTDFGDSSINFDACVWIKFQSQQDYLSARSEVVMRLRAAFEEHNIVIPFPIRTLDFGIKGGLPLSEAIGSTSLGTRSSS